MPRADDCPDAQLLERLVLGQLAMAEAEPVERHVAACSGCARELEGIGGEDVLVESLRQSRTEAPALDAAEVAQLIERLERLRLPEDSSATQELPAQTPDGAQSGSASSPPTEEGYFFLGPNNEPVEGEQLGGYRVLRVLGVGGMGVVFAAEDARLGRHVAIKALRAGRELSDSARERFLFEARAAATVRHDHVVTIYHAGEDRGTPFLVMELLKGETLEARLRREQTLPVSDVLRIGREAAEGLAAAHACGLIHRDVKPSNLWLEASPESQPGKGRVKLLDFGLAWATADDMHGSLRGFRAGTPAYMAPEQEACETVDHRADLFSLGCVLYRSCTGVLPFASQPTAELWAIAPPRPPQDVNQQVPHSLSRLVMQMLARRVEDRPTSARAVVAALAALEREQATSPSRPERPRAGNGWGWLAASALLAGTLTLAMAYFGRREVVPPHTLEPEPSASPPSVETVDPVRTAEPLRRFVGHTDVVWAVALSGDNRLALSGAALKPTSPTMKPGDDNSVRVWNVDTGEELRRFPNMHIPWAVAFDGESRYALAGGLRIGIAKWQLPDWAGPVRTEHKFHKSLDRVAFAIGGKLALSAGEDQHLHLWNTENLALIRSHRLTSTRRTAECLALSPDGRLAAVGFIASSASLWLVDLESGQVRDNQLKGGTTMSVAFSRDGRYLLSGSVKSEVWRWDVQTQQGHVVGRHERGVVTTVAFCPDGRRALSGGTDATLRLWDLDRGRELLRFQGHAGDVRSVTVSADGRYALSGDSVGGVLLWTLPPA